MGSAAAVRDETPRTASPIARAAQPTAKAIEIVAFVPLDSVDPAKPYELLCMALDRSSKVTVAKYAWSERERLSPLRVRDDVIVTRTTVGTPCRRQRSGASRKTRQGRFGRAPGLRLVHDDHLLLGAADGERLPS